ncbi:MAG: selenide, water dikinase SelD [Anaerolineaceae bacterium]|nr:selenide, water dikinase SelD [Anaerolineaceae bacterium]
MSADALEQVLTPLKTLYKESDHPQLLVGLNHPDDAAVWQLDKEYALVLTTDFFTPVVDDAYDYGAIAAANSISDVYAMGGEPFLALNITAFPPDMDLEIQQTILRGAAEKASEAGVIIAGGHTIRDPEPKFGLVVLGRVNINKILTKKSAKPGDHLVITKPLGIGVITTALKQEKAAVEDVLEAVTWMKQLNRVASQLASEFHLTTATDITGYSLLGHAWEMAQASQVGMQINHHQVPFLSNARKYAEAGCFPGGASDNFNYYAKHISFGNSLDDVQQLLLFDPQTSGGLLLAVPDEQLTSFLKRTQQLGQAAWNIGRVIPGNSINVI